MQTPGTKNILEDLLGIPPESVDAAAWGEGWKQLAISLLSRNYQIHGHRELIPFVKDQHIDLAIELGYEIEKRATY